MPSPCEPRNMRPAPMIRVRRAASSVQSQPRNVRGRLGARRQEASIFGLVFRRFTFACCLLHWALRESCSFRSSALLFAAVLTTSSSHRFVDSRASLLTPILSTQGDAATHRRISFHLNEVARRRKMAQSSARPQAAMRSEPTLLTAALIDSSIFSFAKRINFRR
jgi:hypothetical protein